MASAQTPLPEESDKSAIADGQATSEDISLSERIQSRAAEVGLRQIDLAKRSGVPSGLVNAYWKGNKQPSAENLFALARALGVEAEWLLTGDGRLAVRAGDNVVMLPVYDLAEFTPTGKPDPMEWLPVPRLFLGRFGNAERGLWLTAMPPTHIAGIAPEGQPIVCRDVTQRVDAGPHLFFYDGVPLIRSWSQSASDWQRDFDQRYEGISERSRPWVPDEPEGMRIVAKILGGIGLPW